MGANEKDRIKKLKSKNKAVKRAAFEELYSEFADRILNYAYRYLNNRSAAEDIVQDVFVKINELLADNYKISSIGGLLFSIANHMCLNLLKKAKLETVDYEQYRERLGEFDQETDSTDIVVNEALFRLGEEERQIIIYKYFCGFSFKQIAEYMGLTQENVNVKAFRARKKLASVLTPNIFQNR